MVNLGLISADERGAERDREASMVGVGSRVADSVPWIFRWVENTEHSDSYSSITLRISPSFPPSYSTTPPSHTAVGHLCASARSLRHHPLNEGRVLAAVTPLGVA